MTARMWPIDSASGSKSVSHHVAPKDQALDKLLEGLGQTKDAPAPDDKKPGGGKTPGGKTWGPKGDKPDFQASQNKPYKGKSAEKREKR